MKMHSLVGAPDGLFGGEVCRTSGHKRRPRRALRTLTSPAFDSTVRTSKTRSSPMAGSSTLTFPAMSEGYA